MTRTLVPSTPDRTPLGIFRRKLDLSRRLADVADEHWENGRQELSNLYRELAIEANEGAMEYRKRIPRCGDCGHIQNGHGDPLYSHLETCPTGKGLN